MIQPGDQVMVMECYGLGSVIGLVDRFGFLPGHAMVMLKDRTERRVIPYCVPMKHLLELPPIMNQYLWNVMTAEEQQRYVVRRGIQIGAMTAIDYSTVYGWGGEDEGGFWTYPCWWYAPAGEPVNTGR